MSTTEKTWWRAYTFWFKIHGHRATGGRCVRRPTGQRQAEDQQGGGWDPGPGGKNEHRPPPHTKWIQSRSQTSMWELKLETLTEILVTLSEAKNTQRKLWQMGLHQNLNFLCRFNKKVNRVPQAGRKRVQGPQVRWCWAFSCRRGRPWAGAPEGAEARALPPPGPSAPASAVQENFPAFIKGRSDKYLQQTAYLTVKGFGGLFEIGTEMRTPIIVTSG